MAGEWRVGDRVKIGVWPEVHTIERITSNAGIIILSNGARFSQNGRGRGGYQGCYLSPEFPRGPAGDRGRRVTAAWLELLDFRELLTGIIDDLGMGHPRFAASDEALGVAEKMVGVARGGKEVARRERLAVALSKKNPLYELVMSRQKP